jgi:hypothetical protein
MTEYETIAPEISENITLIGNQQETKRETRFIIKIRLIIIFVRIGMVFGITETDLFITVKRKLGTSEVNN